MPLILRSVPCLALASQSYQLSAGLRRTPVVSLAPAPSGGVPSRGGRWLRPTAQCAEPSGQQAVQPAGTRHDERASVCVTGSICGRRCVGCEVFVSAETGTSMFVWSRLTSKHTAATGRLHRNCLAFNVAMVGSWSLIYLWVDVPGYREDIFDLTELMHLRLAPPPPSPPH